MTREGHIRVAGAFFDAHRLEVGAVLRHEARQAHEIDARDGILDCRGDAAGGLHITTTTPRLARALGSTLQLAFDDQLTLTFAGREPLHSCWWRR